MSSDSESDIGDVDVIKKMGKPKLKSALSKIGLSPHGDVRKMRSKLIEYYKGKSKQVTKDFTMNKMRCLIGNL
jgi:hypothetical protein